MAYTGKCELFDDEQGGGDRGDDVAADAFVDGGVSSRLDAGSIIDDGGSNGNGKPVSERTEAYRDFFERITSDDSIRYALEMCVRDATAVSDDQLADGVLTACSGCDDDTALTCALLGSFSVSASHLSWHGTFPSELLAADEAGIHPIGAEELAKSGLRHDVIIADATTLLYGEWDADAGEEPSESDYLPLVDSCLRHAQCE